MMVVFTMNKLIGATLIIVALLYVLLYSFTLVAIAKSKDLIQLPCYRIMISLGLCDIVQVVFLGFVPAYIILINRVNDTTNKVFGSILMFGWYGALSLAVMLAINRLVTVITGSNADNMFSGKKVFIWIGSAVGYSIVQLVVYNLPNVEFLFIVDQYTWIYGNTTETGDVQLMELASDSAMVIIMIICYICLGAVLKAKRKWTNSKKLTANDSRALLSAFLVAANIVATDAYQYIGWALVSPDDSLWLTASQHFLWLITVGNNAIYYLAFNNTVRSAVRQLLPGPKVVQPAPIHNINSNSAPGTGISVSHK